ncbi:MAG: hypothetical protein NTX82_03595 [Candidatus Parcubacteria bacterium]|nr:hypothetical protein [Candidatus Parcubacteria bacterium]
MKKNLIKLALSLALVSILVMPLMVSASGRTIDPGFGYISGYIGMGTQDIRITIANIIRVAMGLLGIVAVLIILIGGFKYMTAMGNEESVKKAKQLIFSGIIGLVIVLCAYAIATFVITSILSATTSS